MENAALLRQLKRQIFAYKVADVFTSSPIVAVYQALGSTEIKLLEEKLTQKVKTALPDDDYLAVTLPCRNKLVALAPENVISNFIQGKNLFVGFKTRAQVAEQEKSSFLIKHSDSILPLLCKLSPEALRARPSVPHKHLAALMTAAIEAPAEFTSLVPLAVFYNGEPISLRAVRQWMKLDEREVFFELLSQVEGPAASVAQHIDDASIGGIADVLAALGELNEGVVSAVDFKAEPPAEAEASAATGPQ